MTYLLLTDNRDDFAELIKLPEDGTGSPALRAHFVDNARTGQESFNAIFVIDPAINDGAPTVCTVASKAEPFDSDDYSDVQVTINVNNKVVHGVGYRIDGRA